MIQSPSTTGADRSINPDEAVDYSAAGQGAILTVKALRSEGQCIGRESFAYGLETAGLAGG